MKQKKTLKKDYISILEGCRDNEIHTFNICEAELDGSTIDKVKLVDGDVRFYYNENTGDYDVLERFSTAGLEEYHGELKRTLEVIKLAEFLENKVTELVDTDGDATYRYQIDGDLAVYVGFENGFDKDDPYTLHSSESPEYGVCVKIAQNGPYLWEDAYMPHYDVEGDVYDTDISIRPDEDYEFIAESLLEQYRSMKDLLDEGVLTF